MSVKKIFMILIVIVACVIIGALVLNILLPNATAAVVNSVEGQIFNATGISFDFNGDGNTGDTGDGRKYDSGDNADKSEDASTGGGDGASVEGIDN